jgi:hypothetical protein
MRTTESSASYRLTSLLIRLKIYGNDLEPHHGHDVEFDTFGQIAA